MPVHSWRSKLRTCSADVGKGNALGGREAYEEAGLQRAADGSKEGIATVGFAGPWARTTSIATTEGWIDALHSGAVHAGEQCPVQVAECFCSLLIDIFSGLCS